MLFIEIIKIMLEKRNREWEREKEREWERKQITKERKYQRNKNNLIRFLK